MNGYMPKIIAAGFALLVYCEGATAENSKCVDPSRQVPLHENIRSKVVAYGEKVASNKLSLKMVMCDLGRPDEDVVVGDGFESISGKEALAGERYVSYGDPRTDTPVTESALKLLVDKRGFVRIMESLQPRQKRSWTVVRGATAKSGLSWGNYTQSIIDGQRITKYSGVEPL
jgi:hypothetical protein